MSTSPFSQLVGQQQAITLLQRVIEQQRIAPGYLFIGPEGTGKSLAATGFAQMLLSAKSAPTADTASARQSLSANNEPTDTAQTARLQRRIRDRNHPDLLWVEPTYQHQGQLLTAKQAAEAGLKRKSPPRIRVPQIRDIARFLSRPALESGRAVVVIEQAERMAEAAANALLKTLEEPGQATLILMAPDQQMLLPTLISRCQSIPFRRLNGEQMKAVLTQTGHEAILASSEVMAIAQGSPGRAIESWEQMQSLPENLLTSLQHPPQGLRNALTLAKEITTALDTEAQLWLLDYLQHRYWQQRAGVDLTVLEQARRQLLGFVQPRLVWEVALSHLHDGSHSQPAY